MIDNLLILCSTDETEFFRSESRIAALRVFPLVEDMS